MAVSSKGRKVSFLHVRTYIEDTTKLCDFLIKDASDETPEYRRLKISEDMVTWARQMSLIGRAILRKHQEKGTRKDVYIER